MSQASPGPRGTAPPPAGPAGTPAPVPPPAGGSTGEGNGVTHPDDPARTGAPPRTGAEQAGEPVATGAAPAAAVAPAVGAPRAGWWAAAARYSPPGAAALAMLALGWWGLARDSAMGNDEVATRWAALLSLRDLAHLLNRQDAVHGLYYLLMHAWVAVGSSPEALRIPSVLAMAVAVALVAVLTRRLTGSGWAALFAGLVMAFTPVISFYAQTARSYAMVVACVTGATLVLVRALGAEAAGTGGLRPARWWLAYGVLVALAGYLNELALLMLVAHAVTVLVARQGQRVLGHWARAAGVGAALVAPLVLISVREDGAVTWINRPGLADLRVLFRDYFGVSTVAGVLLAGCAVVAVLAPARARRRGPAVPGPGVGDAPAWWRGGVSLPSVAVPLVLPALLLLGESLVARPLYVDRYVLYGEAGAAMLAGAGIWLIGRWLGRAARRPGLLWVPGVAVCAAALILQLGPQHRIRTPHSRQFDFGGPSQYVGANARQGDGVLFFGALFRKARLGYPEDFTRTRDFAMAESPQQAGSFWGKDKPFSAVYPLMLEYPRIWVVGPVPSVQLPIAQLREERVLQRRFTMIAHRRFKGIVVTLWQRR
jgi:mannosyltransferase